MAAADVLLGNHQLRDELDYSPLWGHRVAVLSNPTGVFQDTLGHLADALVGDGRFATVALLGPEHGFRGEKQAETGDPDVYVDDQTGLPVYSAYRFNATQIAGVLESHRISTVVVDMQDVGVRLYTFVWTLHKVMAAAAEQGGVGIVVCDRPNPLGGVRIEGPLLDLRLISGYGLERVPHVHGLTIGELASLFQSRIAPGLQLTVIRHVGWKRNQTWDLTGLAWVPPSPNLPTPDTAFAYPTTVFLEATTAAEGRGTTTPFLLFGAPFLPAPALAASLNALFECTTRACFRTAFFEPTFSKFNCTGVNGTQWLMHRTPLTGMRDGFWAASAILQTVRALASPASAFHFDGSAFGHPGAILFDWYAGTTRYRELLTSGASADAIAAAFAPDVAAFAADRLPFLLYD
jgi:uncharacterized protein YbbC (DUF1343 family)